MSKRKLTALAVAAAAALVLSACSAPASGSGSETDAGAPVEGGTLRIGLDRDVTSLDPAAGAIVSQPTIAVAYTMYDGLFASGDNGEVVPQLAESVRSSDDLKTWTITLHSGVTFSNGDPLGAQAVIDHITRLKDPAAKCSCAVDAAEIAGMTALDDITVEFTLVGPNAAFPNLLTRNLGFIASTTADEKGNLLGSGPYVLDEFAKGTSISFVKRKDYWGDPGHADAVRFVFLPDTDSRYQSLVTGAVDLIWTETTSQITQAATDGLVAHMANAATSVGVFNTTKAPFDNPLARQAVQAAIDRKALLTVVNGGAGTVSNGPIVSHSPYEQADYPAFDTAQAKELVKKVGTPIEFTYVSDNRPESQQRATAVQQMLKDVGITMTLKPVDISAWGQALVSGDFQMADMTTSLYGNSDAAMLTFTETSATNFSKLASSTVNDLVSEARATANASERGKLYTKAAQAVVDDAALAFYTENPAGFISSAQVKGLPDLGKRNIVTVQPSQFWLAQ